MSHADVNKAMREGFCACSDDSQFSVHPAIDGISLLLSGCSAWKDGVGSTQVENVVDPPVDPEVTEP